MALQEQEINTRDSLKRKEKRTWKGNKKWTAPAGYAERTLKHYNTSLQAALLSLRAST